jgi:hypothetical protein
MLALSPSCGFFRKSPREHLAAPSGMVPVEALSAEPGVAPLAELDWKPLKDPSFIGLPQGCALAGSVRQSSLPSGAVRFSAPANGSALVVAVDENGDDSAERAGVVDDHGHVGATFPWNGLSAPPLMARAPAGVIAVRSDDAGDGKRRAVLWTPPGRELLLVEGDRLDVVDSACDGSVCAVLTSFASASAGPGATLIYGDPGAPAAAWKRVDLPGEDREFVPFSIAGFKNGAALVALSGKGALAVWRVADGQRTRVATIETPLGAYEVLAGDVPIAVAPGENIDKECKKDGFMVKLLRPDGATHEVDGHVPPETAIVRELDGGFIVGWLSPTRCRTTSRQTIRAFLVGRDGTPRSSTMAVTEAEGFALSTHGENLDLWLAAAGELTWVKATCRVPGPTAK